VSSRTRIRIVTAAPGAERGIVLLDLARGLGAASLAIVPTGRRNEGDTTTTAATILPMNGMCNNDDTHRDTHGDTHRDTHGDTLSDTHGDTHHDTHRDNTMIRFLLQLLVYEASTHK
jgi:hypothetical protein